MLNGKSNRGNYSILVSSIGEGVDLSKGISEAERESEDRNILGVIQEWYPDRDWKTVDVRIIDYRDGGKHAKVSLFT